MKLAIKKGVGFGLTSGVITTLGLIIGLNAGTHSKMIIIAGILTIAIADAFSDALGIHVSEESQKDTTNKEIWASTISTFFSKLIIALTFLIPVMVFTLTIAIYISLILGIFLISLFSFYIAKENKTKPIKIISEHIFITLIVLIITHNIGLFISTMFS
ncbi:hypothetical protein HOD75_04035 [archaeon]|jgi:vacuolar iron transporter family protein|nr:hypothetical protein [archaeon]MBT4242037.1 hypothetical protein [archaeon]MBT4417724.1 hypothetical protein [archaeon]